MKKAIYTLNALLFAAMVALDIALILDPSVLLKGLASACFAAAAIVNFAYALKLGAKPTFPALMLAGCVLAMAGDIVIYYPNDLCFMIGAGLFAAAHVFYVAAYFTLYPFHFADIIAIFCLFLPSVLVITLAPIFNFGGVLMEIVCVVYAVILSLMVGKALANLRKRTALSVLVAIGSILFFISDFMLLLNVFGKIGSVPRILCLATYYPAQFLLAFALILFSERGMNLFKRLYCRTFQGVLRLLLPFLPYKDPKLLHKIGEIPAALKVNGKHKPLIVTDKTLHALGLIQPLEDALKEAGFDYAIYDSVVANPTTDNAEEVRALYLKEGCDGLVGFGGGSPMDCAKCAGALLARPDKTPDQLCGILKVGKKIPLLFAVPTTAGTGSETTLAAVVVDSKTHRKYAINDFPLIPAYAVLDEEVCSTLPTKIISTTGMDALTHAIEAYIGRGGNASARRDALEAAKLVFDNLEKSYAGDKSAAKEMLLASHKAGRAFSKAYVGYVHALAHALGGKYNLAHGLANAVILPLVLREYGKPAHKKLWQIAVYCGLAENTASYATGAEALISKIESMNERFGIGKTFPQIRREDIDGMTAYAEKEANPLYPVPVLWDRAKMKELYEKLSEE